MNRMCIFALGSLAAGLAAADPTISTILPDTGASASDLNTSATTLTITGTATPGATVELLADAVDPPTTVVGTAVASGGTFAITWTSGVAAPGLRRIRVREGLAVSSVSTVYIDPQSDPPAITAVAPGSGGYTNDATPAISGTANPGAAIEVSADGDLIATAVADASGNWTATPSAALPSGSASLTATQIDVAGNPESAASTAFPIVVDTLISEVVLYGTVTGLTTDATPTYTGKAEVGATVGLHSGSASGPLLASTTTDASGLWSLTPAAGLADGPYDIFVVANDAAGNQKASAAQSVVIDTTVLATLAITDFTTDAGTVAPGGTTDDRTISVNGTMTAGEPGVTVSLLVNGVKVGNASGPSWSIALPSLNDAVYSVTAVATDPAGNTSTAGPATITIDAPVDPGASRYIPQFDSEIGGSTSLVTSDSTPTLTGLARPSALIMATVTVVVPGVAPGPMLFSSDAQGHFSYTPSPGLADGTYSIVLSNPDGASNPYTVVVDTVAPTGPTSLGIADDSAIADRITNDDTLVMTATGISDAVPSSGGLEATLRLDGVVVATSAVSGGTATFDLTGRVLPDGYYAATITVRDAAGNLAPAYDGGAVRVDRFTDPPLLGGISPDTGVRPNDRLTRSSPAAAIRGRAEPGATVALTLTGPGGPIYLNATANGSGQFTATVGSLANGTWTIDAVATDIAGNTNLVDTHPDTAPRPAQAMTLVVDDLPPLAPAITGISADSGTAGDFITNDTTPSVSGTAEPGATVEVFVGGSSVGTATADAGGAWSLALGTLVQGAYSVTAQATDEAGNTGAMSVPQLVGIDTTPPTASITSIVNDTTGTLGSLTVGTAADRTTNDTDLMVLGTVEAGSTVELLVGATVVATDTDLDGAFSLATGVLAAGSRVITVRATDAAGNAGTIGQTWTIDTAMANPSISAVSPNRGFVGGSGGGTFTTRTDTPSVTVAGESGAAVRLETSPAGMNTWTSLGEKAATGGSATWTGAELGLVAPDGAVTTFDLRVSGVDIAGNASPGFGTAVLVVDRTIPGSAPTVTGAADDTVPYAASPWNAAPYTTDTYTRDNRLVISGTGAIAAADSYVRVYVNGVARGYVATPAGGAWSVDIGSAPFNVVVPDGALTITARNGDLAGNEGPASAGFAFTVDTVRPIAAITGMTADTGRSAADRITQDAQPVFTGTARDAGGDDAGLPVIQAVLKRGSTTVETLVFASTEAGATDTWSYTVPASQPDGAYTLQATAYDQAGNASTVVSSAFTIDRAAAAPGSPALTAATDTGESATDRITRLVRPAVTGVAVETQGIVRVYRDSTAGALLATVTANAAGAWTAALAADLAEGANTLAITQEDLAGNISSAAVLSVTLDTIPPAAAAIDGLTAGTDSATLGDALTSAAAPALSGTCPADADSVILTATGPGGTVRTVTIDLALGATTWTGAFAGLPEGAWSVTATAVDTAGNQAAASAPYVLTVDRTAPLVAIGGLTPATDSGVAGDLRTSALRPELTGSAGADAVSVTLSISGIGAVVVPVTAGSWSWTPASDLADGAYAITATAVDAAGNVSAATAASTLVVDTLAPAAPALTAISQDTGTAGDLLTSDPTLVFSGAAEAGATVEVYIDGALAGTVVADGGGAWSLDLTSATLADGAYDVTMRATDAAGNAGPVSAPAVVTVDTSTQVPALIRLDTDSGDPNDRITSDQSPTFSGTAEPGASVTITATGPGGPHQVTVTAAADGSWTSPAMPALADGSWSVAATATDPAGNVAGPSAAWPFTIDATPPAAPAVTAFGDDTGVAGDHITADRSLIVSGTAEAGATVLLTRDGVLVAVLTATGGGVWSADLTATELPPGNYRFAATAVDAAGSSGPASPDFAVTVDTTPDPIPLITGVGTDTGSSGTDAVTSDTSPAISGKGVPGSTIQVRDGAVLLGSATVQADGTWSLQIAGPMADGVHPITAVAIDPAGNRSTTSLTLPLVIDTALPTAAVSAIGADTGIVGDGITADATWLITGTGEAGTTVAVRIDGILAGHATVRTDGTWSYDASSLVLADGAHAVTVQATDLAGNTGAVSTALSATVDTAVGPPLVARISDDTGVAGDRITSDRTPVVSGTAEPYATVTVSVGGSAVGTATADAAGAWTMAIPGTLPDGVYTISAVQVDAAGNGPSAAATLQITVDATISVPSILAFDADTGISSTDAITADSTQTIRGRADPGATVAVRLDGVQIGTAVAAADGTWSLAATIPEGAHIVGATASDVAGNSAIAVPRNLVVDLTAPPAPVIAGWTSDTGTTGDGITADPTLTVNGTAEAGATVAILVDGVVRLTVTAGADGTWSGTLPALADGTHALTATATDAAGNAGPASTAAGVVIDTSTTIPAISGIAPDTGRSATDLLTNAATVTVTGVAEAGATVTLVDGASTVLGTATASASGSWSIVLAPAEGALPLRASATDPAGNAAGPGAALTVQIDRTAPAAPVVAIPSSPSSDATPTISGSAEAGSTVQILVGGSTVASVLADGAGAWTYTSSTPWADASYAISARAVDAAGNTGAEAADQVLSIDTVAPAAAAIAGILPDTAVDGDGITADPRPVLVGVAEPNATVEIYQDGVLAGSSTASASGIWILALPADGSDHLSDASYAMTVVAIDAAGNAGAVSAAYTMVIDTSAPAAPAVAAVAPSTGTLPDLITADSTPYITGTAEAGAVVAVAIDGVVVGTVAADGAGSWGLQITAALAEGQHAITATAQDAAGNTSPASAAVALQIDLSTPAPAVAAISADTGAAGDAVTYDVRPVLHGSAEAGATVTVTIRDGASAVVMVLTATADASGLWSAACTADLADGGYTATPAATDALGNAATGSAFALVIDAIVPAPVITAVVATGGPVADGGLTADPHPTVSGTAAGAVEVAIYLDGALVATVPVSAGVWSADLAGLGISLADGTHAFHAVSTALSQAVGPASADRGLVVDTATPAPVLSAVVPSGGFAAGGVPATPSSAPTLSGLAEPGATVSVSVAGGAVQTAVADASGTWTVVIAGPLADGLNSVAMTATDPAGNSAASTASIFIDTTAPVAPQIVSVVPDTGRSASDRITAASGLVLDGTAEAGSTVIIRVGAVEVARAVADGAGQWSVPAPGFLVSEGDLTINAEAVDATGNTSPTTPLAVTIDRTAPASPAPVVPAAPLLPGRDVLTGIAEADALVSVYVDGVLFGTATTDGTGAWSLDIAGTTPGRRVVTTTATDAAGNVSQPSGALTVTVRQNNRRIEVKPESCGLGSNLPLVGLILFAFAGAFRRRGGRSAGMLLLALAMVPAVVRAADEAPAPPPATSTDPAIAAKAEDDLAGWRRGGWEVLVGSAPRPKGEARYIRSPFSAPSGSDWDAHARVGVRGWGWRPDADGRQGPWAACELGWFELEGYEAAGTDADPSLRFKLQAVPFDLHVGWRWQPRPWLSLVAAGTASAGPVLGRVAVGDSADGSLHGADAMAGGWLWGWGALAGARLQQGPWEAGLDVRLSSLRANLAFERREIVGGRTVDRDPVEIRQDLQGISWAVAVGYRF